MATKQAADRALSNHAERLRRLGAHALRASAGTPFGLRGYVVVAWVRAGAGGKLPKRLDVKVAGKATSVPVHVEEHDEFEIESL